MTRKEILKSIIDKRQDAILVKNKYHVLYGMIKRMYPNVIDLIPKDIWEDIIFDSIAGNRDWQFLTEGKDKETKEILRQQFIIDNYIK